MHRKQSFHTSMIPFPNKKTAPNHINAVNKRMKEMLRNNTNEPPISKSELNQFIFWILCKKESNFSISSLYKQILNKFFDNAPSSLFQK